MRCNSSVLCALTTLADRSMRTPATSALVIFPCLEDERDAVLPDGDEALYGQRSVSEGGICQMDLAVAHCTHDDEMRISVLRDGHDRALHAGELGDAHVAEPLGDIAPAFGEALHVEQGKAAAVPHAQRIGTPQHCFRSSAFRHGIVEAVSQYGRQGGRSAAAVPLLHD